METPRDIRPVNGDQSSVGLILGVGFLFLTIVAFGLLASRAIVSDRDVQEQPAIVHTSPAEQPGVPPAAVAPATPVPGKTSPQSQQPADAVDPGATPRPNPQPPQAPTPAP